MMDLARSMAGMSVIAIALLGSGCAKQPSALPIRAAERSVVPDEPLAGPQEQTTPSLPESSAAELKPSRLPDAGELSATGGTSEGTSKSVEQIGNQVDPIVAVDSPAEPASALCPVSRAFTERVYLPDRVISLTVAHPSRIADTKFARMLPFLAQALLAVDDDFEKLGDRFSLRPRNIERLTIFVSTPASELEPPHGIVASDEVEAADFEMATDATEMPADAMQAETGQEEEPLQVSREEASDHSLRQIYQAFQDYDSAYSRLPRADGDGQAKHLGLSWRVHLLPFLDEDELYGQFHLDEPWDSTHNRTLIPRMPKVFRSPDVDDEATTSIHVITGPDTFFPGGLGVELSAIGAEVKTTILVILADAAKADVWTKPGGLEIDLQQPKKIFGGQADAGTTVLLADGDVTTVYHHLPDQQLARQMTLLNEEDDNQEFQLNLVQNHPDHARRLSLQQIGSALLQYHSEYFLYPRSDGDGPGAHTGLSWRVYLLPYLGYQELYDQFHLDESWDSDHNQTLISQMPAVFKSPDVSDEGKTSIHVFTGEKTLFHGPWGRKQTEITDPLEKTILAVATGPETADVWTKPGGLAVDLQSPRLVLGKVDQKSLAVLMANGGVESLSLDDDKIDLARLIQPADGGDTPTELPADFLPFDGVSLPGMIVTFVAEPDRQSLFKHLLPNASDDQFEGQSIHHNDESAIWFPEDRTMVTGPVDVVKSIIADRRSGKVNECELIGQIDVTADLAFSGDVESVAASLRLSGVTHPALQVVQSIASFSFGLNITAEIGDPFIKIDCEMKEPPVPDQVNAAIAMAWTILGFDPGQAIAMAGQSDARILPALQALVDGSRLELSDESIQIRIPAVEGLDRLVASIARAGMFDGDDVEEEEGFSSLQQLAKAFAHYHEAFGSFPGAGRPNAKSPEGLSWRVYLLPFLGEPELFHQFHLDEPWDSDHNKTLIEKMPRIFAPEGTTVEGKTSIHVFVGPGAAFGGDRAPKAGDFAEDPSLKILAVVAGGDRAEIWTRPGGLDFDPADPLKSLGTFDGHFFRALMASGDVCRIEKIVIPANLRRMIEFQNEEELELTGEQTGVILKETPVDDIRF